MRKILILALITCFLILSACSRQPIKVAFVGCITGDLADLGVPARNAFLLRARELNETGGINGRMIEVVVFDDQNNPDNIPEIYEDIREQGIEIVGGHLTSAMVEPVLVEADKGDVLILSGSLSSSSASGIDDMFVRTTVTTDAQSLMLSEAIDSDSIERLLIVSDSRNAQFSEDISSNVIKLTDADAKVMDYTPYTEMEDEILNISKSGNYDGVLLIVPAKEAAYFSQYLKSQQPDIKLYGVSWSKDQALIEYGGQAVEGFKFTYRTTDANSAADIETFQKGYQATYKEPSSFIGELTYEMAMILFDAVANAEDLKAESIKNELIGNTFDGMTAVFTINEYGDRDCGYDLLIIEDGEHIKIEVK